MSIMGSRRFTEKELKDFERYEKVRSWGGYNMVTEAESAAIASRLTFPEYIFVQKNYRDLKEEYENSKLY